MPTQLNLAPNAPIQTQQYETPFDTPTSRIVSTGTVSNNLVAVLSNQVSPTNPYYTSWVDDGFQVMSLNYSFSKDNLYAGIMSPLQAIAALTGGQPTPVSFSMVYNLVSRVNASLVFTLFFYDSTQTVVATQGYSTSTLGVGTMTGSTTVPANAQYMAYRIAGQSTGAGSINALIDTIQVTLTPTVYPYFDGDDLGYQWTGQRGNSPSVQVLQEIQTQLIEPEQNINAIVIDGVTVDPLTPNMALNIYYSTDDSYQNDHMIEANWEQKLWTRIPEVYICTQRQQFVFPKPILAKYMKLEFTNLQSRAYTPGEFQKPVQYKKFPTWVANYFVMQMELPTFVGTHVQVEYDALRFAYDYYLDDLHQAPETPQVPVANVVPQLTNYFTANANAGVDPVTLAKINLVMNKFTQPQGANIDTDTTLGSFVSNLTNSFNSPPLSAESSVKQPIDYTIVSSLQREPLLFEQTLPVMYFFIPCRHSYKELSATFDYNRAYFAGVKNVAFQRNIYAIASDTPMYIESGGDAANIEITDWVFEPEDLNWYAY